MRRMFALLGIIGATVCAIASPATAATVTVSPTRVPTAGTVTVSGDVLVDGTPGCSVEGEVTLISDAFEGLGNFAEVGAVFVPIDASGHFSESVTLKPAIPAGVYSITGRCGGGNMGIEATLTVTGLAETGAGFGPFSVGEVFALGLALAALGVALTRAGRRRNSLRG